MSRVLSYGCSSSAGPTSSHFWRSLCDGVDHSTAVVIPMGLLAPTLSACLWQPRSTETSQSLLSRELLVAWKDAWRGLTQEQRDQFPTDEKLGIIFASTKGCIDDFIWDEPSEGDANERDPFTPILDGFLDLAKLSTSNTLCVSNACASSLGALYLAQSWIEKKRVTHVLVLAADHVGRFVMQGFQSLQALSPTRVRPFAENRDGLRLGEAATAILLCEPECDLGTPATEALTLEAIGMDTEGHAVTRPSQSGSSLKKACSIAFKKVGQQVEVDLVIAHGTATQINDVAEDQVFRTLFPKGQTPITATKGSIGHTLAASGAMDFIAGCSVLRTQRAFRITNTTEVDSRFLGHYLAADTAIEKLHPFDRVMTTSLGFGGVHAAALIRRGKK